MRVHEIMTPKVETVAPETSLDRVAQKMAQMNIGCVPVSKDGRLLGVVTDRDIACRVVGAGKNPAATKVQEAMSKDVAIVSDQAEIGEAAKLMAARHVSRLPVLNKDSEIVGILSIADIASHAPGHLAQTVLRTVGQYHH